jgi:hypothetical protein
MPQCPIPLNWVTLAIESEDLTPQDIRLDNKCPLQLFDHTHHVQPPFRAIVYLQSGERKAFVPI